MPSRLLPLLVLAVAAGCATTQPSVPSTASPSKVSAYIGGNFTLRRPTYVTAFVVTNVHTGKEHVLPFTASKDFTEGHNETGMIRVPPGTYRVSHWTVFNPAGPGGEFKAEMKGSRITQPFTVNANEVVFLGKFVADNAWTPGYHSSTTAGDWLAEKLSSIEARDLINRRYPRFAGTAVSCLGCAG